MKENNKQDSLLALEDGSIFYGFSLGVSGCVVGEVVFNTAITGYQEIITDPSYDSQIITFTNPHIGNTGFNQDDFESNQSFCPAIIIREQPIYESSWRKQLSLKEFLKKQNLVAISGIDTRLLTKILRDKGSQNGCIIANKELNIETAKNKLKTFSGLLGLDLAKEVTTKKIYKWNYGKKHLNEKKPIQQNKPFNVIAYDFGIKHNILRILNDLGCNITIVPAEHPSDDVLSMKPDGIFLSNGPGDPKACTYAIDNIKHFLDSSIPIFGICLGFQLLALASGAKTIKMKFGHHGANHPVIDLKSKKVFITSQNHGFMVDRKALPQKIVETHVSLFDDSLQGFERKDVPAFGFQGHPEASPGPHDIDVIFKKFIDLMRKKN
ncbi:MAG: carbamoyl-phosphate synthase small subunit [Gammaproteobacteria bacterium]|nr:carbamoyl-phosphate synthase small subunit [Gammaproteobacteria bacterium]|tara:strand:+ start:119578 stop:120717 length:1140 start_codon:yes stop_codon:yes gene_type:complete